VDPFKITTGLIAAFRAHWKRSQTDFSSCVDVIPDVLHRLSSSQTLMDIEGDHIPVITALN
jgi:hypothetical protein